jgi:hypothetical protein
MMHTARPIAPGSNEIGITAMALGVVPDFGDGVVVPDLEIQLRHGINENSDFGIKYTAPLSLTADYNFAIINTGSFALSIDPTVSPMYLSSGDSSAFWLWAFAPVLIDVLGTESFVLTVNVKPGIIYASGTVGDSDFNVSSSAMTFLIGGGLGAKFKLGETFALMPEFNVLFVPDTSGLFWTGALGFLF